MTLIRHLSLNYQCHVLDYNFCALLLREKVAAIHTSPATRHARFPTVAIPCIAHQLSQLAILGPVGTKMIIFWVNRCQIAVQPLHLEPSQREHFDQLVVFHFPALSK